MIYKQTKIKGTDLKEMVEWISEGHESKLKMICFEYLGSSIEMDYDGITESLIMMECPEEIFFVLENGMKTILKVSCPSLAGNQYTIMVDEPTGIEPIKGVV